MKLYAWQPKGHGEQSLFVMAENEQLAIDAVQSKIKELVLKGQDDNYFEDDGNFSDYDFNGFETDYYELTVASEGVVILNSND